MRTDAETRSVGCNFKASLVFPYYLSVIVECSCGVFTGSQHWFEDNNKDVLFNGDRNSPCGSLHPIRAGKHAFQDASHQGGSLAFGTRGWCIQCSAEGSACQYVGFYRAKIALMHVYTTHCIVLYRPKSFHLTVQKWKMACIVVSQENMDVLHVQAKVIAPTRVAMSLQ